MDANIALVRVNRFLRHRWGFMEKLFLTHVSDPRDNRGKSRSYISLLHIIFVTLVSGGTSPRDAESLSEKLTIPDPRRPKQRSGRIPDTTLYEFSAKLRWRELVPVLVGQLRGMCRRQELAPHGLPCGVLTVDGKSLGKLTHSAEGKALKQSKDHPEPFYHLRVLRAVLSSSAVKVCAGQEPVGATEGEITALPRFVRWLSETYGRYGMFEIFDLDAGFLSREIFHLIDQVLNYGVIIALKRNVPDLYREASRVLLKKWKTQPAEVVQDWEQYQGKELRRSLFRTDQLDNFLDWRNVRQGLLVVQETREKVALTEREYELELEKARRREKRKRPRLVNPRLKLPVLKAGQSPTEIPVLNEKLNAVLGKIKGKFSKGIETQDPTLDSSKISESGTIPPRAKKSKKRVPKDVSVQALANEIESCRLSDDGYLITVELRFFITNLNWGRLTPAQILLVVRNHWAVENDCFHSLDVQWREDAPSWSTAGEAQLSIGMMRLLAYNYAQQLRQKHVRVALPKKRILLSRPWKKLFDIVTDALTSLYPKPSMTVPVPPPIVPANFRSQRGARGDQNSPFLMQKGGFG